ncbi:MAG: cyclodeaminase/cyclohydrolase family protein [Acidobacteriaceae bacterium]
MSSLHIRAMGEPPGSLWELKAEQICSLAASLQPTPGSGSIALLTATLALALVQKGASISSRRAGEDPARRDKLSVLCEKISATLDAIRRLVDADSQAIQSYLQARSLPRGTDADQSRRSAAMQECLLRATTLPLTSAREIRTALEHAATAVQLSDLHLLSDIFGGVLLMQAAARAILLNVDANLRILSNPGSQVALQQQRVELEAESNALYESIARTYQARLEAAAELRSNSS